MERTRINHCRNSKGNNSKIIRTRVTVLVSARRLMMLYISTKFHENILKGFQVRGTRLRDGRIDRRTDNRGKNNMSPPLSRGDIIQRIQSIAF